VTGAPLEQDRCVGALASLEPSDYGARPMTTPQDPGRRRKEKARRSKQLAAWRSKKAEGAATAAPPAAKKNT